MASTVSRTARRTKHWQEAGAFNQWRALGARASARQRARLLITISEHEPDGVGLADTLEALVKERKYTESMQVIEAYMRKHNMRFVTL